MNKDSILQNIATNPNNQFIWISASAGTGKTKILVDRVLRLLIQERNNILCLTFTNTAVHEITERIYSTLEKWAIITDKELKIEIKNFFNLDINIHQIKKIRKLFANLTKLNVKIQTLHSFCHNLLSSFPIEAGISPNFHIIDFRDYYNKIEDQLLRNEEIQRKFYSLLLETTENNIRELIYNTVSYIKNYPLISRCYEKYIFEKLEFKENFSCSFNTDHLELLSSILMKGSPRDQKVGLKINRWIHLTYKQKQTYFLEYSKIFIDLKLLQLKPITSLVTQNTLKNFPNLQDILIKEQLNLLASIKELNTKNIANYSIISIEIAEKFIELYDNEKCVKGSIDYDDIIHLTLKLLTDPDCKDWILFNLDYKINHILIDESQDNSLEQWNIIAKLCEDFFSGTGTNIEKRTLFIVGDVKQSIYSFQNARPDYFVPMKQYFMNYCQDYKILNLNQSFRSAKSVLYLVDKIFNKFRREISFLDEEIIHKPYRTKDEGLLAIWPLIDLEKKHKKSAWNIKNINTYLPDSKEVLALKIAEEIYKWINTNRLLTNKNRKIVPEDIMILVRHRDSLIDHLISKLKKFNIPVTERDRFNILDHIAIKDLINLGEFLLLPENDITLANLLKSPIFDFSDKELFMLAYERQDICLWERVQTEFNEVAIYLNELLNINKFNTITFLYTYILNNQKTKFVSRLGKECLYYIEEFLDIIVEFEYKHVSSLENFIYWIKRTNPEIKNDFYNQNKAVRIMTVHNAKGLQSPIVFLADTTTLPKNNPCIIVDNNGVPFCPLHYSNTYINNLIKIKKTDSYNEYLRLLYVAITRAEDELYITGKSPSHEKSWYNIIKQALQ